MNDTTQKTIGGLQVRAHVRAGIVSARPAQFARAEDVRDAFFVAHPECKKYFLPCVKTLGQFRQACGTDAVCANGVTAVANTWFGKV